ncbi:MAG TPA: AbrB/MazE/SpoVT family DNA-binding domain-containing protein [Terracidiphilus sp.]|nr:AbrB/MazE/SpoVT family DNA-binding domain-containing protein [Terracidiphilus sp.]
MQDMFTIVSSKGQLVIPSALRDELGIEPGTRVAIRREGDDLILRPMTRERARRLVAESCGMFKGPGSLADELIADRNEEDRKAGW